MLRHWHHKIHSGLREYRSFFFLVLLMSIFRSSIADWNDVPTSSMRPTIIEGDRILINKLAYDVQLPFLYKTLFRHAEPQRGDIVVFESKLADKRLIKRVVGLPGDHIAMSGHRLLLNGQPVDYVPQGWDLQQPVFIESTLECPVDTHCALPAHQVRLDWPVGQRADFADLVVPDGQYLVLGDNRANSADSRYYGFVPRDEIIGRARRVVMSFDRERYFIPRASRLWQPLDPERPG